MKQTTPLDSLTRLSTDHAAVTAGSTEGVVVSTDALTDGRPRWAARVDVGDDIMIAGQPAHIGSYAHAPGCEPHELTISPAWCGTICTLYLTHRPFVLRICNGGIYAVDPEQVVLDE